MKKVSKDEENATLSNEKAKSLTRRERTSKSNKRAQQSNGKTRASDLREVTSQNDFESDVATTQVQTINKSTAKEAKKNLFPAPLHPLSKNHGPMQTKANMKQTPRQVKGKTR